MKLHDQKTEHFKAITSNGHSSAIAEHVTLKFEMGLFWHFSKENQITIVKLRRLFLLGI